MDDFNPFSLNGKNILVTGASSGIGREIAVDCAKMGGVIFATGRNEQKLKETLSLLPKGNHKFFPANLTIQADVDRLVGQLPMLDGIVQCAGVGTRVLCKNINYDDIRQVIAPNLEAPILLQSALLAEKKINKSASIVFLASKAYNAPSIGNAIYSASKGAIISYSKCLALELAPRLIRVNCISPAMVWTELILQGGVSKEQLIEAETRYPLKRYGTPDDVAFLVIYLLSDASMWMTGSNIELTGGARDL